MGAVVGVSGLLALLGPPGAEARGDEGPSAGAVATLVASGVPFSQMTLPVGSISKLLRPIGGPNGLRSVGIAW